MAVQIVEMIRVYTLQNLSGGGEIEKKTAKSNGNYTKNREIANVFLRRQVGETKRKCFGLDSPVNLIRYTRRTLKTDIYIFICNLQYP